MQRRWLFQPRWHRSPRGVPSLRGCGASSGCRHGRTLVEKLTGFSAVTTFLLAPAVGLSALPAPRRSSDQSSPATRTASSMNATKGRTQMSLWAHRSARACRSERGEAGPLPAAAAAAPAVAAEPSRTAIAERASSHRGHGSASSQALSAAVGGVVGGQTRRQLWRAAGERWRRATGRERSEGIEAPRYFPSPPPAARFAGRTVLPGECRYPLHPRRVHDAQQPRCCCCCIWCWASAMPAHRQRTAERHPATLLAQQQLPAGQEHSTRAAW